MKEIKILIADDSRFFRELGESFLDRHHCKILKTNRGDKALEIIKSEMPDVAVLDIGMPGMRGDEYCKMIKADPYIMEIPVIMVVNSWERVEKYKCRCAGCNDIIEKPIDGGLFLASIKRFVKVQERACPRIECNEETFVSSRGKRYVGNMRNVSRSGAFIECETLLPVGSYISAQVTMKGIKIPVEILGRIVRAVDMGYRGRRYIKGFGVVFSNLSDDALVVIEEFVARKGGANLFENNIPQTECLITEK